MKRTTGTGWFDSSVTYFGATVLHKRKPFNDAATVNRAIVIKTRNKPGNYHVSEIPDSLREGLKQLCSQSLQKFAELPDMSITGRAADTWKPLIAVAATCGDIEWLMYSLKEVKKAVAKLKLGQEFEPEAEVFNALVASSKKAMVPLSEIRDKLEKECNWQPSAWAVADMVRDLGFEVKTSHGERKVVIDKELLEAKARELGIEVDTEPDISIRNLSG